MTTPLPPSTDFTAAANQGAAKTFVTSLRTYLNDLLGPLGHGFDAALVSAPRRITVAGTADAMTATLVPAITAYTTGMRVTALLPGANTVTGPTINLNSLGNKTVKKKSGTGAKVALVAGDYNATLPFELEYDGTDFVLLNPLVAARTDIASAATLDLSATSGGLRITGTTTVTAVTLASGQRRVATADVALPLTNGASLILPGAANYTCTAGDILLFIGEPAGVVRVAIWKANGTAVVAPAAALDKVVQVVEATPYVTYSSTATSFPYDDNVPQNTAGAQWNSVTITPTNASNRLRIEAEFSLVMGSGATDAAAAIFQDSNANALATSYVYVPGSYDEQLRVIHEMAAGTTSATTFKVRAGCAGATLYINGNASVRKGGGTAACRMRVTEIKP